MGCCAQAPAVCDSCRRLAAQQTIERLWTPREDGIPSMQGEGRVRAREKRMKEF